MIKVFFPDDCVFSNTYIFHGIPGINFKIQGQYKLRGGYVLSKYILRISTIPQSSRVFKYI